MFEAYFKWAGLAVANLVVTIVAYIIAPILPAFANDEGWLPPWLMWFQTQDNSLDGDDGWKNEHYVGWPRYIKRVLWLWRNPAYGFSQVVCAFKFQPGDDMVLSGDPKTSNIPGHSGWVYREIYREGRMVAWQYYCVKQNGDSDTCKRINFGWKLWDFKQKPSAALVSSIGLRNQFNK